MAVPIKLEIAIAVGPLAVSAFGYFLGRYVQCSSSDSLGVNRLENQMTPYEESKFPGLAEFLLM